VCSWIGHTCSRGINYVHVHVEVITEVDVAHNGEEVDEDDPQDGRENDGASISRNRANHIHQRLLLVSHVEEL